MFTLILPGLLRENAAQLPLPPTPALNHLLRFGRFAGEAAERGEMLGRWLGAAFDLPANQAYASPVCQRTGMNSIMQHGGAMLGIGAEEAEQWCRGLNEFFAGDAEFAVLRPDLWLLTLPEAVCWQAPPLWQAEGLIDGSARAQGENARQWLSMQTEIQMWLHAHPLNSGRGIPVNAVWLWTPPALPAPAEAFELVGSSNPWRSHSTLNSADEPQDFAAWQQQCRNASADINRSALWLDALNAGSDDPARYLDILAAWEKDFFAPAWDALKTGSLKGLRLVCDGLAGGILTVPPKPQFAFWKRRRTFKGERLDA